MDPDHRRLSVARQCALLGLPRSSWYYVPAGESAENLALMKQIDAQYLATPFYGSRKLAAVLGVNRKRVQRLMRRMGIAAIGPRRRTTWPAAGHKVYPYLLRNVEISRPDQVWSTDITYIPLRHGFLYLVAVLDWYSRYVQTPLRVCIGCLLHVLVHPPAVTAIPDCSRCATDAPKDSSSL